MRTYTIHARRINDPVAADGYGDWDEVGEWQAETPEDALFFWMDQQPFEDDRFVQTGENSYKLDDFEYECEAEAEDGINIIFEGGQAMDGIHGCVYMLGRYVDDDGDEQELYAEVLAPDTEEECDDDFGYDELKAEIIKQAKEAGISEERLIFPGKPFA